MFSCPLFLKKHQKVPLVLGVLLLMAVSNRSGSVRCQTQEAALSRLLHCSFWHNLWSAFYYYILRGHVEVGILFLLLFLIVEL